MQSGKESELVKTQTDGRSWERREERIVGEQVHLYMAIGAGTSKQV